MLEKLYGQVIKMLEGVGTMRSQYQKNAALCSLEKDTKLCPISNYQDGQCHLLT